MTGPRCDKCRYWEKSDGQDWEADGAGMNACLAVRQRWDIADEAVEGIKIGFPEDAEKYTKIRAAALAKARAYVQDGSEYRATLVTGPDFFCALFEVL